MPTNRQIISNLNLTGNFLEAAVFSDLLESQIFLATAEWPFTQPSFQGTADIVALNHNVNWDSEPLVFLAIECKKVKNDQKVWVFDSTRADRDLRHPMIKITNDETLVYEPRTGYLVPNLGVNRVEDVPLFNKGYELRGSDGNLNRNESEKIYLSLTQANRAAVAITKINYKSIFQISPRAFENNPVAIVPVVITNASLKSIEYNASSVDRETGEINVSGSSFTDRDWLMFDYPLPDELQLPGRLRDSSDLRPIKRPTYIIQASNAINILKEICSSLEY